MAAEQETSLSIGSRGEVVKELQQWLNYAINAALKEDGIYGNNTSQAVSNFQRESGIEEDGIAGVNTIESIISYEGEGNEEKENGQAVQGSQEEVNASAQEEPEEEGQEEVTPSEPQPEEQPQAEPQPEITSAEDPAAPEEVEAEPAATQAEPEVPTGPEGEDPLMQQQQQTTVGPAPAVPQSQDEYVPTQMDPLLDPRRSKEDQQTANRWQSYANRPAPASPEPTPRPIPNNGVPEIQQATQQIQQQQPAGNNQNSSSQAQASTDPATSTVAPTTTPAEPEAPAPAENLPTEQPVSTDPATSTVAPEEVPIQGYNSRDQFRNDLSQSFLSLKQMINGNSKDGLQELQAQLANIQQRAQASGQNFPKLTKYLTDLQGHAAKWGETFESIGPTHRPILLEEEKSLRQKMQGFWGGLSDTLFGDDVDEDFESKKKEVEDRIRERLQDEQEYIPRPSPSFLRSIEPTDERAFNLDKRQRQLTSTMAVPLEWTGPSIKYLSMDHKDAIVGEKGAATYSRMNHLDPDRYLKRLNNQIKNGKTEAHKRRAREELKNYKNIKGWLDEYMVNGKPTIDINTYTAVYKEVEDKIPFILENGKVYDFLNLEKVFSDDGAISKHIKYCEYWSTKRYGVGELLANWQEALNTYKEMAYKLGNEHTQELENLNDDELAIRHKELKAKDLVKKLSPEEQRELEDLSKWHEKEYLPKLRQQDAAEEQREDENEAAAATRVEDNHKLNQEALANLEQDIQNPATDDSLIAASEEEGNEDLLELAKDHAARVAEFLTTTIEGIGWSEENAPLETDQRSELYAGIGARITNFLTNLNKYKETASMEDFATLEKDFDDIVTLVDDYSTTT